MLANASSSDHADAVTAGAHLVCVRAEWRGRWRSYVLVAGVGAIAVMAVVATLGAAGRSETAFARLRAATRAGDASLFFPDPSRAKAAVPSVVALDGVARAAAEVELFVRPAGTSLVPDYNLYARAPLTAKGSRLVNTPVIIEGRSVDPGRADEMVMSERLAAELGVSVGDTVPLESMTTSWVEVANTGGDPGPPDGPTVKVVVVGLARTPADFARFKGLLHLSPGFVHRYGGHLRVYSKVEVVRSNGTSRRALDASLRAFSKRNIELDDALFGDNAETDAGLNTIATSLRLVAAVAALAGAVVLVLAIARLVRLGRGDRRTLVVLGWTTRQIVAAAALAFAPWLLLGTGLGLLGGTLTSPQVLVDLARRVDPTPASIVVDARVVLGVGVVTAVIGLVAASLSARRSAAKPIGRVRRPSGVLHLQRPLPVVLGARHALFGESEQGGRASRGAAAVMAVCTAGAVAALVVSASISRLQTDPTLIGQSANRVIDSGESVEVYDRAMPILVRDRRVAVLAGIHVAFGISAQGGEELPALAYEVKRGDLGVSVVRGRIARRPGEVALGPSSLDRLGKEVGDRVRLRAESASAGYLIVGAVLFPEGDFAHDSGLALTTSGANRLLGDVHDAGALHQIVFEWADGVDARRADRELVASGLQVLTNRAALKPASVTNLGQVAALPRYLAAFLAVLSLATLGHVLTVSVRRRSREIGTLRALGMTPRSTSAIVAAHAFTILSIALVVGIPLGLAVGAKVWAPIANGAHVVVRSVVPASPVTLLVFATIAGAAALAVVPAWRAFRLHAADTLRAE